MTELHDLQDVLDETAQDITQVLPHPDDWGQCVIYLMQALEVAAMDKTPNQPEPYHSMLGSITKPLFPYPEPHL